MAIRKGRLSVCAAILFLFSISPPLHSLEIPTASTALVHVFGDSVPFFNDDGDLDALSKAAGESRLYYAGLPPGAVFNFGGDVRSAQELAQSSEALELALKQPADPIGLNKYLREHFDVYRSLGSDGLGQVIFSAYYEHRLAASLAPAGEYRYPIYARPKDLVDVDLSAYDAARKGDRLVGRLDGMRLVPYYSREEIDSRLLLKGRGLEIAWARSPLDILLLQIQGSGWIEVAGSTETRHIRYAGDNGRPFRSIGQYLIESGRMPRQDFSRAKMIAYLNAQGPETRQSILNQNQRYIFYEIASPTNSTRGALMVPLTPGRSIASDPKFYPPGALAWLKTQRPTIGVDGVQVGTAALSRFVLNQDEGGAIKGAGRIDFFAGGGAAAELMAQKLWYPGELYFLVLKKAK